MSHDYVHGYSDREDERLVDQARTLTELLHADTRYPAGSSVLEAGCGVGAQTVTLARNSPGARFTCIDLSPRSLDAARARVRAASLENVAFRQADIFELPYPEASFDHVFLCFVLEHLARPREALAALRARLRPGGTLTVIEGDHGSTFFHPDDADARRAVECLVTLQARAGGNANLGRQLQPLLAGAGFLAGFFTATFVGRDGLRAVGLLGRAVLAALVRACVAGFLAARAGFLAFLTIFGNPVAVVSSVWSGGARSVTDFRRQDVTFHYTSPTEEIT